MSTMEFYYSSDEETNVDYDKYKQTPYTDPSVIKKLWREHFSRKPKQRNREVTRAFEMKCSFYQFIHPDLSRDEVRSRALDDIGVRSSSTASKKNTIYLGKAHNVSEIINEKDQERLEKSSKKQNKHKKSKKDDVDECQVKNKSSKISKIYIKDQNTTQKPSTVKKLKPPKKTKVLAKIKIETSQIVFANLDLNKTNKKESGVKNVRISGKESSYSSKTRSTNTAANISQTCTNDDVVTSTSVYKKTTHRMSDKKVYTGVKVITKSDTCDKSLQEKNYFVQKHIKTTSADENEVNSVKAILKLKNTKVKGQENMSVINTTKTKVTQGNSSKMVHKLNIWKKIKVPYSPLQNLTSLDIVKYKKMGSNKEIRNDVTTKNQEGSSIG